MVEEGIQYFHGDIPVTGVVLHISGRFSLEVHQDVGHAEFGNGGQQIFVDPSHADVVHQVRPRFDRRPRYATVHGVDA